MTLIGTNPSLDARGRAILQNTWPDLSETEKRTRIATLSDYELREIPNCGTKTVRWLRVWSMELGLGSSLNGSYGVLRGFAAR